MRTAFHADSLSHRRRCAFLQSPAFRQWNCSWTWTYI